MEGNSHNSSSSRDPIWTRVAGDPRYSSPSRQNESHQQNASVSLEAVTVAKPHRRKGLSVIATSIFIAGEMAGSGVLALPRAVVDAGWIGFILVVVFCFNAAYGGTRLGECWTILEERFPEYRGPVRNPYATIALKAVGLWAKCLVSVCMQITLFGASTVYLLLASQLIQELFEDMLPQVSYCIWFLLLAICLCPAMWLGSPKDFWAVGIGALITTTIACGLLLTQIVVDGKNKTERAEHPPHGFEKFFLAFGTLMFAFGGASTFPTIQNDMNDRKHFPKAVIFGFVVVLLLFMPITIGGYVVFGDAVEANIALSTSRTTIVLIANFLMAAHFVLGFLIVINPVCQELELIFHVPRDFHWKRCLLRTLIISIMVVIGETIPNFAKIISLVGGSTTALLTFVFPQWFYMRLCDMKHANWPERSIPLYARVYMWELIVIGLAGGTATTYNALSSIFSDDSTSVPCYLRTDM